MPRVINRRREGVPQDAVYVGRPSVFGNPYRIADNPGWTNGRAVDAYRGWINQPEQAWLRARMRRELKGKDLVCWCAPNPCHADVILEIANG